MKAKSVHQMLDEHRDFTRNKTPEESMGVGTHSEVSFDFDAYVNDDGEQIVPGENEEEYLLRRMKEDGIRHRVLKPGHLEISVMPTIRFTGPASKLKNMIKDLFMTGDETEDEALLNSVRSGW